MILTRSLVILYTLIVIVLKYTINKYTLHIEIIVIIKHIINV